MERANHKRSQAVAEKRSPIVRRVSRGSVDRLFQTAGRTASDSYSTDPMTHSMTQSPLPAACPISGATFEDWRGCYTQQWRGLLDDGSWSHPGKFAKGLIERVIMEGLNRGWWKRGDRIVDPFGGVGCGGVACAYSRLEWIGVELEPEFVKIAIKNFERHLSKWASLGCPTPQIFRGDSRLLSSTWPTGATATLTSPPYASGLGNGGVKPNGPGRKHDNYAAAMTKQYGASPGQLAKMPLGKVDATITSPPYLHSRSQTTKTGGGNVPTKHRPMDYGEMAGQVGNANAQTYWSAVGEIYAACASITPPRSPLVIVIKDFVKAGAIVPLCEDTVKLLMGSGFAIELRARCWVADHLGDDLHLNGTVERKERSSKSFFRRLQESRGCPRIDYEEVIVARTPA